MGILWVEGERYPWVDSGVVYCSVDGGVSLGILQRSILQRILEYIAA